MWEKATMFLINCWSIREKLTSVLLQFKQLKNNSLLSPNCNYWHEFCVLQGPPGFRGGTGAEGPLGPDVSIRQGISLLWVQVRSQVFSCSFKSKLLKPVMKSFAKSAITGKKRANLDRLHGDKKCHAHFSTNMLQERG